MSCICDKCSHLWQRLGKNYCRVFKNCKYSKTKKECPYFKKGENIKKYLGSSNGWWKKKNKR